jgi:hypothetical protein
MERSSSWRKEQLPGSGRHTSEPGQSPVLGSFSIQASGDNTCYGKGIGWCSWAEPYKLPHGQLGLLPQSCSLTKFLPTGSE